MPNYLDVEPANPVAAGLAGYSAVQDITGRQTMNALRQQELEATKRQQSALQQFGQGASLEDIKKTDPKTWMQVTQFVNTLDHDKRKALAENIDIFDKRKALYINNPESYAEDYKNVDAAFRSGLIPPEKFAKMSPQERQADLFAKERITNSFKHALNEYQQLKLLNVDIPKTQAYIAAQQARTGQGAERVAQGWANVESRREGAQTTLLDPETNLPIGKERGKVTWAKPPGGGPAGAVKVMTEDEALSAGNVPKGTRIIKRTDPEYNTARHEAVTRLNADPRAMALNDAEKGQKINALTADILREREGYKAQRQGRPTGKPAGKPQRGEAPPVSALQEGHATTFKNGQKWTLQNGEPVRIQ
jgi:hypothetical protein